MVVQGLQKLTLLDYPEHIACTVFLHGCNLRCPFCHNAPLVTGVAEKSISGAELGDFLEKRKNLLQGVCVTGGEPLLQKDIIGLLEYIKSFGYKVKLDTNGLFPERLGEVINMGLADYIAMDIKSSKSGYAVAAGVAEIDISALEESVEIIKNSGIDYEFRTTAVKGLHTAEDFTEIGKWLGEVKNYFIQSFKISENLISNAFSGFSKEEMTDFLGTIKEYIPNAKLRGV